ncbi:hypothetical protein [Dactylosporangium sp. NPDC049140]|uniref:TY-Chap domain-containing protein n=1 Tax=Dactylosporangium sp. NPDC049140 TaxID=3155647 RepID=UPI0033FDBFB1
MELRQAERPLDEPFVLISHEEISILDVVRCVVCAPPGRSLDDAARQRLRELGWRSSDEPDAQPRRLLSDASTPQERLDVARVVVSLFRDAQGATGPDRLTYRAWYAAPGEGTTAEEILVNELGLEHLRMQYLVRFGPGNTITDPGELLRVVRIGQFARTEAMSRTAVHWTPVNGPDPAAVAIDEFRARYIAARWGGSRFRFARTLGADLDERAGAPLANPRRAAIVRYLREAPLVAGGIAPEEDPRQPGRAVPRDLHSDGLWIWPASLAYHADRYGVPPEPDLLVHIERQGAIVPVVAEVDLAAASHLLFS